jgi:hypothetical protein
MSSPRPRRYPSSSFESKKSPSKPGRIYRMPYCMRSCASTAEGENGPIEYSVLNLGRIESLVGSWSYRMCHSFQYALTHCASDQENLWMFYWWRVWVSLRDSLASRTSESGQRPVEEFTGYTLGGDEPEGSLDGTSLDAASE